MDEDSRADAVESSLQELAGSVLTRSDMAQLVEAFGARVGADGLRLDEDGVAALTVDDELEICLIHLPHWPGLVAAAPLPEAARTSDAVLRALLQANMSWERTGGGSFALVPQTNQPMFCRLIPLATPDAAALDRQLAEFVELAQAWHDEIELFLDDQDDDEEPAAGLVPEQIRV